MRALILLVIDGLDELRYHRHGTDLLDWLVRCPELSGSLRVVLTSRPDDQLLQAFRASQAQWLREVEINAGSRRARDDVRRLTAHAAEEPLIARELAGRSIAGEDFATTASERAAGNFQYATALLRAIGHAIETQDPSSSMPLLELNNCRRSRRVVRLLRRAAS